MKERYANAWVDASAFELQIARCSLSTCRGMCCYDGVYVDDETAVVLKDLARTRASDFSEMGLPLPKDVIVHEEWHDGTVSGEKTATKPFPFRSLVGEFPSHFNETACVFHLDDGRCGLQVLAENDGKHPWFYKPLTCWLHPIDISPAEITIHNELNDPLRFPDYDGYVSRTICGRECRNGSPARDVLREELDFLGQILDRDLFTASQANMSETDTPQEQHQQTTGGPTPKG